jgi:hypothetical protein
MSISPVTLPTGLDPTFQQVMLQSSPTVEETQVQETIVQSGYPPVSDVTVQATTEGQLHSAGCWADLVTRIGRVFSG